MKRKPKIGELSEVQFSVEASSCIQLYDNSPLVLSTPWLIWHMEQAALEALRPLLDEGESSVGVQVDIKHLAATPVGHRVRCSARVIHVDARIASFQVEAHDELELVARGVHKRSVIDNRRFEKRVNRKSRD